MVNSINRKVALFDICHTLVGMTTIGDFTRHFLLSREFNKNFKLNKWAYHFIFRVFRKLHIINNETYRNHYIKLLKGYSEKEISDLALIYFDVRLQKSLKTEILNKLNEFKLSGYEIFLVSAGFDIYLKEFAEFLGATLICTIADKNKNTVYTGKVKGVDCYGYGKIKKIQEEISFCNDIDWSKSVAFSDDASDIPLLSLVGSPFVVDPSTSFENYAKDKNWEIIKTGFFSPFKKDKKKMNFIIRDDDLNYFSKPSDIDKLYSDVLLQDIPVSFSTIPFVKKDSDVYTEGGEDINKEYKIGENIELVSYLKDHDNIEIIQHGCTHETIDNVYEFNRKAGLLEEAKRGFDYLKSIFGDIKVFVAPHDSFSNHGIFAVESVGLNIIRSKGSRNFIFRYEYFTGIMKMIFHRIRHLNRHTAPAYPYIIDWGKHKETYSYRLIKDKELLKKWLICSANHNSYFIIVNHLHSCDEEMKTALLFIIGEAKKMGFSFTRASELFK